MRDTTEAEVADVIEGCRVIEGLARHRYRRLADEQKGALAHALIEAIDALTVKPAPVVRLVPRPKNQRAKAQKKNT